MDQTSSMRSKYQQSIAHEAVTAETQKKNPERTE